MVREIHDLGDQEADQGEPSGVEALVDEHCPDDAALRKLARIVHCADFRDEIDGVPEARGLRAISDGFPLVATSDDDTVARAAFLYDALYAALAAELTAATPTTA